ncbi:isopentenyl-diphosphate Delta-isomerase [Caenorhabditis elegans]|uniref:isopentenyl-diphosphate Delta-isomerase n=1 Tax=Caenorhabditis elegans TaxID=6239 RepID=G5EFQ1_CAEEL|nr:isopentenyl-diphosphate Delta-isomerase [Caenorhabditis elegans]AAT08468.1 isopentenyl-diphosphate isomerase [Caenorhabditis elegans]CCD64456.1 isopentenyl-diphosphate Delta-isomerase [Caenorhabditis elegans]|eukprot:NP_498766.1 Isopentenyl Diphosphate Isomerase [Caenorhabditis elegans]
MKPSLRGLSQIGMARRAVELSSYDAQQVEYMREQCINVDENDRIIGGVSKREAHSSYQLVLHRAFSVFSFTSDNKLLMQKRSAEKITFPNLWTNTCCSHPLHTQQEMDGVPGAKRAAIRKLEHELGITGVSLNKFQMAGKYIYRAEMNNAPWGEHELDYALILRGIGAENCNINENEVAEVREVVLDELKLWMRKEPNSFTPWLKLFSQTETFEKWWTINKNTEESIEDTNIYKLH